MLAYAVMIEFISCDITIGNHPLGPELEEFYAAENGH
jgi:hypothetical protein